jgi:hypothetical protein
MVSVLLDTCVLVPSRARDVLLEVASAGAYRPLWSSEVLTELDRALRRLLGKRGVSPEETMITRLQGGRVRPGGSASIARHSQVPCA